MDTMHDRIAIQATLDGKPEAYRSLVDRYRIGLIRYVFGLIGDQEVAHDLAQEAFVVAYQKLRQYDAKYPFSTWLYRIARNLAYQDMKYHGAWAPFDNQTDENDEPLPEELSHPIVSEKIRVAMARLRPEWRSVIQLHYWEDKTTEEIADLLNESDSTVRGWLSRARATLRGGAKDDKDQLLSQRLIQGRPRLKMDVAFTARVMAEVREAKVKHYIPWRKVIIPAFMLLVIVGASAGGVVYLRQQMGTTISNGLTSSQSGNLAANGSGNSDISGKPTNLSDYQNLATEAQNDIGAMSLQTGKFSDTDYADAQMADNQIF